jgi:hypothetical protein
MANSDLVFSEQVPSAYSFLKLTGNNARMSLHYPRKANQPLFGIHGVMTGDEAVYRLRRHASVCCAIISRLLAFILS